MNITEVRLTKGDWGKTKALASITIDGSFVVTGLKVIESSKGTFVAMPQRKGKDEKWVDIAFPITSETRQQIQDAVLAEYGGGDKAPEYKTDDDGALPF